MLLFFYEEKLLSVIYRLMWCSSIPKEGCVLWLVVWLKKKFCKEDWQSVKCTIIVWTYLLTLDNFWLIWCRTTSFWLFFSKGYFYWIYRPLYSLFYQIKIKVQWNTKGFGLPKKQHGQDIDLKDWFWLQEILRRSLQLQNRRRCYSKKIIDILDLIY